MVCLNDFKEILVSAFAFVIDKEARQLSSIKYPNGAGMSVREAKVYGLYVDGKPLTPEHMIHLQELAVKGITKDKAVFVAAKWNLARLGNQVVRYIKSDVEGSVVVSTTGPAHVSDEIVFVPLETIGNVLIEKIELLPTAKYSPVRI
jgi:hypothetical protein